MSSVRFKYITACLKGARQTRINWLPSGEKLTFESTQSLIGQSMHWGSILSAPLEVGTRYWWLCPNFGTAVKNLKLSAGIIELLNREYELIGPNISNSYKVLEKCEQKFGTEIFCIQNKDTMTFQTTAMSAINFKFLSHFQLTIHLFQVCIFVCFERHTRRHVGQWSMIAK